jgi:tetratricopeptide (TPR) repeat protein
MKQWLLSTLFIVYIIPCFSQIDSLETELGQAEGKEKLIILDALAQATVKSQDGLSWADKLKAAATDQGDAYYMALSHHYRGSAFESEGNVPNSILEHLEAIKLFKKIERLDKVARQYVNIGNRYADIGLYDSALSSYEMGEELAKLANDTMALYGSIINISTIHHDRGDKEMEYLMKAQDLIAGIGDPNQLALMKYNIAVFYAEDGQRDKAFDLADEAYSTYQKSNDAFGMGSVHTLWAEFYFKDDKQDSALL